MNEEFDPVEEEGDLDREIDALGLDDE